MASTEQREIESTRHFISETLAHLRRLTADQRHDAAARVRQGLPRLGATLRSSTLAPALAAELALLDAIALG